MKYTLDYYVKFLVAIVIISIGVALTYTIFEEGVYRTIELIWHEWFDTDEQRLLIIPLIFILTAIYFWLQHILDAREEAQESHGLGSMPAPTLKNYGKILLIGFFSLIAGASLGPEAILVPACMLLGAYTGRHIFAKKKRETSLLAGIGIIALFTAFFHSILIGILTVLLVKKQLNAKLTPRLIIAASLTAFLTYITLDAVGSDGSFSLPSYSWDISISTLLWSLLLVVGGYIIVQFLALLHDQFRQIYNRTRLHNWQLHAGIAATGLTVLYLLGGPLVQFTGNHSILPMSEQASVLGTLGLIWVLILKTAAIAWSKAMGYRGGMIFPTIFLAATLVVIVQLQVADFNAIYGLIAVMIGAFVANQKSNILA